MYNMTQHKPTPDQLSAGVVDLSPEQAAIRNKLITFDELPSADLLEERAAAVAALSVEVGASEAMIGGAPFFMAALEAALYAAGITPFHAFTKRESVETTDADGKVTKTNVFVHAGFVQARRPTA